jgi:hypothetical protein
LSTSASCRTNEKKKAEVSAEAFKAALRLRL